MENVTSSPYWPQGNDKAEAVGKIAKLMYQKNKDIHLALLDYRNTQSRDRNTHQVKESYPDALEAYFLWRPSFSSLKLPIMSQSELTHVDPEQNNYDRNLCGTAPKEIQPSQWLYAKPNPKHKHPDYCYSCSLLTIESYESDDYSLS